MKDFSNSTAKEKADYYFLEARAAIHDNDEQARRVADVKHAYYSSQDLYRLMKNEKDPVAKKKFKAMADSCYHEFKTKQKKWKIRF